MSSAKRAVELQKKIFQSLKSQAAAVVGPLPEALARYEKSALSDFRSLKKVSFLEKSELISLVRSKTVTFIADYHCFEQAQRTALRIAREAVSRENSHEEDWAFGLEMISSQYQETLDAYCRHELSLEAFLESICYHDEWGFPWHNYAPLFEWAKKNRVRMIALNRPTPLYSMPKKGDLKERDEWAAAILVDLVQKNPKLRILVLYGEHHVGTKHLPRSLDLLAKSTLGRKIPWLVVHQNEEKLYWKLTQHSKTVLSEIVRIKSNVVCVLSSPPWAKLQSFVNWAEGSSPEFEHTEETGEDTLALMKTYGEAISNFFSIPAPRYENVSLFTIENAALLEKKRITRHFSGLEKKIISFHINTNHRFYLPRVSAAYIGSPSHNGLAELAALHFLKTATRSQAFFAPSREDYFRQLLEAIFGFFGSLILNPRRKCDYLQDHLFRIARLENGARASFPQELLARKLTVELLRGLKRTTQHSGQLESVLLTSKDCRKNAYALRVSAKFAGQFFGKKLHLALISNCVTLDLFREVFFTTRKSTAFPYELRYRKLTQAISTVKMVRSKRAFL